MFTPRIAWGLDIGESSVKAVKIRRTQAGAEILAFDSVERAWPSEETGDRDFHLRNAITELASRNDFKKYPLFVSIPEPAFSRFIPLPPVDRRRIPEVVRYEARQQIPFPIEEVVWDYHPVREATEPGEETEVAIFSLRSQFVYTLLTNLALCKIQPAAVLPVPLALYNFLTFDRDIAKGTIVVDLGAGSTDILICDSENFRVRNITVSGNGITRALADRLKITAPEAEALKRECQDKTQAARLFKLIQPTLNDLIGQVQRTIGFFKSQIHNVRIEQALLLGNTFKLPGIPEFFVTQLGCDLMQADVLERVAVGPAVDSAALKKQLPSLAVALGLGLQGVGLGRVSMNLMPAEQLQRQEINRKRPFAAAAVGCLGLIVATSYLSLNADLAKAREWRTNTTKAETTLRQIEDSSKKYRAERDAIKGALGRLDAPGQISHGQPPYTGYRGTLTAYNTINDFLKRIPPPVAQDIAISSITITNTRYNFSTDQLGGAPGGERPAARINITVITRKTDPVFLEREFVSRLRSEKIKQGDKERPVFILPKGTSGSDYEIQPNVNDGNVYNVSCYIAIDN